MRSKFFVFFFLFVSFGAFAAGQCPLYRMAYGDSSGTYSSSKAAACAVGVAELIAANPKSSFALRGQDDDYCHVVATNSLGSSTTSYPFLTKQGDCPDSCSDSLGKLSTLNFTVGWARSGTPDARDYVGAVSFPSYSSPVCSAGCTQELTGAGTYEECWRSATPSPTGLHRLSCDRQVRGTGKSCTPGPADAAHDSKAPPAPCPGFTGEVNGETKCVGTASKPIPGPSGQGVADATGKGEQNGNPTAGTKPGSGEGSGKDGPGRTPTAGTGTASGGPAAAAGNGTKPDGTTDKPTDGKEQAACGAPGQAKCSINESGTPDGKSAFDQSKGEMEAQGKRQLDGLDGIKRTDDKDTSWGVIPSWIAHGECSPWNLGTLPLGGGIPIEIDICRIVPYVNAVSNFLWAVFTFFATISMVFRVTTATKD